MFLRGACRCSEICCCSPRVLVQHSGGPSFRWTFFQDNSVTQVSHYHLIYYSQLSLTLLHHTCTLSRRYYYYSHDRYYFYPTTCSPRLTHLQFTDNKYHSDYFGRQWMRHYYAKLCTTLYLQENSLQQIDHHLSPLLNIARQQYFAR